MDKNTVTIQHYTSTYSAAYEVIGNMVFINSESFVIAPVEVIKNLSPKIIAKLELREAVLGTSHRGNMGSQMHIGERSNRQSM